MRMGSRTVYAEEGDFSRHYLELGFPYLAEDIAAIKKDGGAALGILSPKASSIQFNYGGLGLDYGVKPFLYELSCLGGVNMGDFSFDGDEAFDVGALAMEARGSTLYVDVLDESLSSSGWTYQVSSVGSASFSPVERLMAEGLPSAVDASPILEAFLNLQQKRNATVKFSASWDDGEGVSDWVSGFEVEERESIGYLDDHSYYSSASNGWIWAYHGDPSQTGGNFYEIYSTDGGKTYSVSETAYPSSTLLYDEIGFYYFNENALSFQKFNYEDGSTYSISTQTSITFNYSSYYTDCNIILWASYLSCPIYGTGNDAGWFAYFFGSPQIKMFTSLSIAVNEDQSFEVDFSIKVNDGLKLCTYRASFLFYDIGTTVVPTSYLEGLTFPEPSQTE